MKYTIQIRKEHSTNTLGPGVIGLPGRIRTTLLKTADFSPLRFAAHLILVLILTSLQTPYKDNIHV